ncbi:Tyrosine-protein kinase [Parasponia andersonii]|uniref:Tyrosine-protein kinase n=1 Tax=Parasponia andersonii TaxID=3476 RepID=A0A2P5DUQ7_PARAD|nr:Tyrosine-protein kinase [Parasponia andersonii]
MGDRWTPFGFGFGFSCFLALILCSGIPVCLSLNHEGLLLFAFRVRINSDPFGVLESWNPNDDDPCFWSGVNCIDGKVRKLNMSNLSLEGTLGPELGKISNLRALVLSKNHFSGSIPKEIGELRELELLDLRDNSLSGTLPAEIGRMQSLKHLFICDNRFEGSIPLDLGRLNLPSEFQFDDYLASKDVTEIGCMNRNLNRDSYEYVQTLNIMKSRNKSIGKLIITMTLISSSPVISPIKGAVTHYLHRIAPPLFNFESDSLHSSGSDSSESHAIQSSQKFFTFTRRKLLEQASNLQAAPANGESPSGQVIVLPMTRSSGAFPAVPKRKKPSPSRSPLPSPAASNTLNPKGQPSKDATEFPVKPTKQPLSDGSSENIWKYIIIVGGVAVLLIVAAAMLLMCRSKAVTTIRPWKTGLSGQLQKAFVTGVPKLNRPELETACEDFSNIISTVDGCIVYKGTLSSGVEIAVASTTISSFKDWKKVAEMAYRKKIDALSRMNHKNFVNLIGFCEEDEPFARMMVFEYAPNGTLYEHLHVKEFEHLDWNARMRIVMGTAYCLQYMHHDLNPPVAHPSLASTSIFLTDDYAAKIAEVAFWANFKSKNQNEDDKENSELPPSADPESNVYGFGILLLEIISGKLPYSEEQGSLVAWASQYLNDKRSISYMIDLSLKCFKNNELDVICEVIQDCIQPDPRQRPTMKEITSKLRAVISISPDQATPRLSPLWWAELEILSVEAT